MNLIIKDIALYSKEYYLLHRDGNKLTQQMKQKKDILVNKLKRINSQFNLGYNEMEYGSFADALINNSIYTINSFYFPSDLLDELFSFKEIKFVKCRKSLDTFLHNELHEIIKIQVEEDLFTQNINKVNVNLLIEYFNYFISNSSLEDRVNNYIRFTTTFKESLYKQNVSGTKLANLVHLLRENHNRKLDLIEHDIINRFLNKEVIESYDKQEDKNLAVPF